MVPAKSHKRYRQLVTGEFEYAFKTLAGGLCISRNMREVRKANGGEVAIAAAIDDVHAFFVKYENTLESDIKAIFQ